MPSFRSLLRYAWLDFASALAFLLLATVWLDQLPDRGTRYLFVPIVLDMGVLLAIAIMRPFARVSNATLRYALFGAIAAIYFGGAWLLSVSAWQFEHALWPASWLFVARFVPATHPVDVDRHLAEVMALAGYAGLVWGFAFVAFVLLVAVVPGENARLIDGVEHSTVPRWIYVTVWTAYFAAQGVLRAGWLERRERERARGVSQGRTRQ